MDGPRFDNLARSLAGGCSRRALLRGLAGLAGGLPGVRGRRPAQTCRAAGRLCNGDADCCSGSATPPTPTRRGATAAPARPAPSSAAAAASPPPTSRPTPSTAAAAGCAARPPPTRPPSAPAASAASAASPATRSAAAPASRRRLLHRRRGDPAATVNPANACQACLPATSTTAWSIVPIGRALRRRRPLHRRRHLPGRWVLSRHAQGLLRRRTTRATSASAAPSDGACVKQPKPNGTACNDGNALHPDRHLPERAPASAAPRRLHGALPVPRRRRRATRRPAPAPTRRRRTARRATTATPAPRPTACDGAGTAWHRPGGLHRLDQCHVAGDLQPGDRGLLQPERAEWHACNDGNACTTGDTCQGGALHRRHAARLHARRSSCLTATCDPDQGCVETPKAPGTACGDGNACNGNEVCNGAGPASRARRSPAAPVCAATGHGRLRARPRLVDELHPGPARRLLRGLPVHRRPASAPA